MSYIANTPIADVCKTEQSAELSDAATYTKEQTTGNRDEQCVCALLNCAYGHHEILVTILKHVFIQLRVLCE